MNLQKNNSNDEKIADKFFGDNVRDKNMFARGVLWGVVLMIVVVLSTMFWRSVFIDHQVNNRNNHGIQNNGSGTLNNGTNFQRQINIDSDCSSKSVVIINGKTVSQTSDNCDDFIDSEIVINGKGAEVNISNGTGVTNIINKQ